MAKGPYTARGLHKAKGPYHDRATGLCAFWEEGTKGCCTQAVLGSLIISCQLSNDYQIEMDKIR